MDRASLAKLLPPELPHLRRYAMALCEGNQSEADDLVQETMVRALMYCDSYVDGNFRAWINTVARNLHRERRKRYWREVLLPEQVDERIVRAETVTSALDLKETINAINLCISPENANTLLTTSILGLTETEAAEDLGVSNGTIKSRCSRARKRLKEHLEETEPV